MPTALAEADAVPPSQSASLQEIEKSVQDLILAKSSQDFLKYFGDDQEASKDTASVRAAACQSQDDVENKVDKLLKLAELLSTKGRDDNAVIFQLFFSMEDRINKRIESVRDEILGLIGEGKTPTKDEVAITSKINDVR
jgi:hypothetical protein